MTDVSRNPRDVAAMQALNERLAGLEAEARAQRLLGEELLAQIQAAKAEAVKAQQVAARGEGVSRRRATAGRGAATPAEAEATLAAEEAQVPAIEAQTGAVGKRLAGERRVSTELQRQLKLSETQQGLLRDIAATPQLAIAPRAARTAAALERRGLIEPTAAGAATYAPTALGQQYLAQQRQALAIAEQKAGVERAQVPALEAQTAVLRQQLQFATALTAERQRLAAVSKETIIAPPGGAGGGGGRPPTILPPAGGGEPPRPGAGVYAATGTALADDTLKLQQLGVVQAQASQQMRRHGALTVEFLQALARGETTLAEFRFQIGATIGKFAGWTGAAAAVYGALGAVRALGEGAIQTQSGTRGLERFLTNVNTDKAAKGFRDVSAAVNEPIASVSEAQQAFARIFKTQDESLKAAQVALTATKLDAISTADSYRYFTGIVQGFKLSAADLPGLLDQINAGQRDLGVRVSEILPGIARSSAAIRNAGGDLSQLIAIIVTAQRATGTTGNIIGTALRRSATTFVTKKSNQDIIRSFGLDPDEATRNYTQFIVDATNKAATLSGQQRRQLAVGIGGPQFGASVFAGLLRNTDLLNEALGKTAPDVARGKTQEELRKKLAQVDEQLKKVGVTLGNLGSALAQSGAFVGLGLGLKLLNSMLTNAEKLVEAFDKIPGHQSIAGILELVAAVKVLRSTTLGFAIGQRTGLPFLGPSAARVEALQFRPALRQTIVQQTGVAEQASLAAGQARSQIIQNEQVAQALRAQAQLVDNQGLAVALQTRANTLLTDRVALERREIEQLAALEAAQGQAAFAQARLNDINRGGTLVGSGLPITRPSVIGSSVSAGVGKVDTAIITTAIVGELEQVARTVESTSRESDVVDAARGLSDHVREQATHLRDAGAILGSAPDVSRAATGGGLAGVRRAASAAATAEAAGSTVTKEAEILAASSLGFGRLAAGVRAGAVVAEGAAVRVTAGLAAARTAVLGLAETLGPLALPAALLFGLPKLLDIINNIRNQGKKDRNHLRALLSQTPENEGDLDRLRADFAKHTGVTQAGFLGISPGVAKYVGAPVRFAEHVGTAVFGGKTDDDRAHDRARQYQQAIDALNRQEADVYTALAAGQLPSRTPQLPALLHSLGVKYTNADRAPATEIQSYFHGQVQLYKNQAITLTQLIAQRDLVIAALGESADALNKPGKASELAKRARQVFARAVVAQPQRGKFDPFAGFPAGLGAPDLATDFQNAAARAQNALSTGASAKTQTRAVQIALAGYQRTVQRYQGATTAPELQKLTDARATLLQAIGTHFQDDLQAALRATTSPTKQAAIGARYLTQFQRVRAALKSQDVDLSSRIKAADRDRRQVVAELENPGTGVIPGERISTPNTARLRQRLARDRQIIKDGKQILSQTEKAIADVLLRILGLKADLQQTSQQAFQSQQDLYDAQTRLGAAQKGGGLAGDQYSLGRAQGNLGAIKSHDTSPGHANFYNALADIQERKNSIAQTEAQNAKQAADAAKQAADEQRQRQQETIQALYSYRQSLTSDPVKQDKLALQQAEALRPLARTRAERLTANADVNNTRRTYLQARQQSRYDDIEFESSIGKITNQVEISQLQTLLRTIHHNKELRRQVRQRIYELQHQTDQGSDFADLDVGNIKLPTVYDVRRLVAQGTASAPASIRTTNNFTMNVTKGADVDGIFAAVKANVGGSTRAALRSGGFV